MPRLAPTQPATLAIGARARLDLPGHPWHDRLVTVVGLASRAGRHIEPLDPALRSTYAPPIVPALALDTRPVAALDTLALRTTRRETMETRHRDALDFESTAVWVVRALMLDAYALGRGRPVTPAESEAVVATLSQLARTATSITTLETRRSDALDFYDLAVWTLRDLALRAWDAGRAAR